MYEMVTGELPVRGRHAAGRRRSSACPRRRARRASSSRISIRRWDAVDPALPGARCRATASSAPATSSRRCGERRRRRAVDLAAALAAAAAWRSPRSRGAAAIARRRRAAAVAARRADPGDRGRRRPRPRARRSVAVLGFRNVSGRPDAAWLSTAFAEMLTTELAAGEQLRTIPGENVARMKIELALADADTYAPDTLGRIREQPRQRPRRVRLVRRGRRARLRDDPAGRAAAGLACGRDARAGQRDRDRGGSAAARVAHRAPACASGWTSSALPAAAAPTAAGVTAGQRRRGAALRRGPRAAAAVRRAGRARPAGASRRRRPALPAGACGAGQAWSTLGYDERARGRRRQGVRAVVRRCRARTGCRWRARIARRPGNGSRRSRSTRRCSASSPTTSSTACGWPTRRWRRARRRTRWRRSTTLRTAAGGPPIRASTSPRPPRRKRSRTSSGCRPRHVPPAARGEAQGARLLVARAALLEGTAALRLGEPERAIALYEQARATYDAGRRSRRGLASALNDHGQRPHRSRRHRARPSRCTTEALAIARGIGHERMVARLLNNLAIQRRRAGDLDGSLALNREALAIRREIGDRTNVAVSLNNIGNVLLDLGDLGRRGRGTTRSGWHPPARSATAAAWRGRRNNAAVALKMQGEMRAAHAANEEALAIRRDIGDPGQRGDFAVQHRRGAGAPGRPRRRRPGTSTKRSPSSEARYRPRRRLLAATCSATSRSPRATRRSRGRGWRSLRHPHEARREGDRRHEPARAVAASRSPSGKPAEAEQLAGAATRSIAGTNPDTEATARVALANAMRPAAGPPAALAEAEPRAGTGARLAEHDRAADR